MPSPFTQKALHNHLLEYHTLHRDYWHKVYTQVQADARLGQQTLAALFVPFQHSITISPLDEQQLYFLVEQNNAALYTLRIVLSGVSILRQIGMLLASQAALDAHLHISRSLPINVQWLVSGTNVEEDSTFVAPTSISPAHASLLDGSGWPDLELYRTGTPCIALGCKGRLGVELTIQTADAPLPSSYGSIVPNAAWRLIWAIGSLKDAREEIVIDGFYDTLLPAEDDEIALLHALPDVAQDIMQQWHVDSWLMDLKGFQQHYAHLLTPTCTITSVQGGEQGKNNIPAEGRARVDFQLLPGQNPGDIFAKLRHHLDACGFQDVQTRVLYSQSPIKTPAHHAFVQWVRDATHSAYSKQPVVVPLVSGTNPFSILQDANTPTAIITTACDEQTGYQQEQQFIAVATQIALLIEHIRGMGGMGGTI